MMTVNWNRLKTLCACVIAIAVWPVAASTPHLPGKFVWAELVTDDVPAARHFYGGLFGWTFREENGLVTALNRDEPVAGLYYMPRPKDRPAKPRWVSFMSVADPAQARATILGAGGQERGLQRQVPARGELGVYADAEGAVFGIIRSEQGDPEDYLAEPGDWIWLQLLTHDTGKAGNFYQAVAGYEMVDNSEVNPDSVLLVKDGFARAVVKALPEKHAGVPANWLPFIRVENIAEAVSKVVSLGGRVTVPPRTDLYEGRVALVADPAGAVLGIMEWDAVDNGEVSP